MDKKSAIETLRVEVAMRTRQVMEDELTQCYQGEQCGFCRPALKAAYARAVKVVNEEVLNPLLEARDRVARDMVDKIKADMAIDTEEDVPRGTEDVSNGK